MAIHIVAMLSATIKKGEPKDFDTDNKQYKSMIVSCIKYFYITKINKS